MKLCGTPHDRDGLSRQPLFWPTNKKQKQKAAPIRVHTKRTGSHGSFDLIETSKRKFNIVFSDVPNNESKCKHHCGLGSSTSRVHGTDVQDRQAGER